MDAGLATLSDRFLNMKPFPKHAGVELGGFQTAHADKFVHRNLLGENAGLLRTKNRNK
jgi:hypothetical protein